MMLTENVNLVMQDVKFVLIVSQTVYLAYQGLVKPNITLLHQVLAIHVIHLVINAMVAQIINAPYVIPEIIYLKLLVIHPVLTLIILIL